MNKRVGSLKEFEFEPLSSECSLHVTIAISGWLSDAQPGEELIHCGQLAMKCCRQKANVCL